MIEFGTEPKPKKPRERILDWLATIGETDQQTISEVIELCRADGVRREYFLRRADE